MITRLPELRQETADPATVVADVLVVALEPHGDRVDVDAPMLAASTRSALRDAATAVGHGGGAEETQRIPAPKGVRASSVLLLGLGPAENADAVTRLRDAAGAALRSLSDVGSVVLALPAIGADEVEAVATGALLGAYRHAAYRSDAAERRSIESVAVAASEGAADALGRAAVIARAVAMTRDLVNQPPMDLFPESFAAAVVRQAEAAGGRVVVEVVDETALRDGGFGGLLGVGGGSSRPPRLVRVDYEPGGAERHLALVGKGITFDSGGISLKPAANMEKMKSDMAGAAAVAQALFVIAELGLPLHVTAWLALAENMPSGSALRPSDVVRIHGGTTVEVTNTDAEGRLVLADALVAAQRRQPDLLVDVATLTGAQVTALGRRTSGVMGTPGACARVIRASEVAGEPMWGMPIPGEMIRYFDSTTADLKNAGAKAGGMLAAAAFLREFVEDGVEWAHLDIAGPAFNAESAHGHTGLGGTGVAVRTLVELAASMAEGAEDPHAEPTEPRTTQARRSAAERRRAGAVTASP